MALVPEAIIAGGAATLVEMTLPVLGGLISEAALTAIMAGVVEVGIAGIAESIAEPTLTGLLGVLKDYGWAINNPEPVMAEIYAGLIGLLSPLKSVPGMNVVIQQSPLVIDIDNSSTIDLVSLENSTARFDFWGDGFAEATAWVDAADGLLVRDLNANGLIENGNELFGSEYPLGYAPDANLIGTTNGFVKLAALDTNDDGLVNAADAAWNELQVWQDTNQDGISQAEELHSLSSLGIASFDVADYQNAPYYGNGVWGRVIEGNVITHTDTVNMTGGGTRAINDNMERTKPRRALMAA